MATFGELISERRKALGLSQKELAAKVLKEDGGPISPQYLNDLERDRRGAPSDYLIEEFARVLELDKDALYYSAGEVSPDLRGLNPETEVVKKAIADFRKMLEKGDAQSEVQGAPLCPSPRARGVRVRCRRHSYVWIPRSGATFENQSTGELIAFDLGVCRRCGHYKPRIHVYGPGDIVDAEIWAQRVGLEVREA